MRPRARCCDENRPRGHPRPPGIRTRRWVDGLHRRDRLTLMLFHLPLQATDMILQPSSRMLEGIIDGKPKIGVALVCGRSAADADFATVRERKMNVNLVETADPVVP